jgi:hypothetical protein
VFYLIEQPFLRLKKQFTVAPPVDGNLEERRIKGSNAFETQIQNSDKNTETLLDQTDLRLSIYKESKV